MVAPPQPKPSRNAATAAASASTASTTSAAGIAGHHTGSVLASASLTYAQTVTWEEYGELRAGTNPEKRRNRSTEVRTAKIGATPAPGEHESERDEIATLSRDLAGQILTEQDQNPPKDTGSKDREPEFPDRRSRRIRIFPQKNRRFFRRLTVSISDLI